MKMVALLIVAIPFAGVHALGQTPSAKVSGTLTDQVGGLLPYVGVVLTHRRSMAHREARTDQLGHFEIEALTPGDYVLEAERSGFATLQDSLKLDAGEHLQHDITLQIGSLEERITVTDTDVPRAADLRAERRDSGDAEKCEISAIGGDLRPPMKIRDPRPEYPRHLRDARIKGSVVLAGRVSTDGRLHDVRVVTAAHRDLADASIAALNQWLWTPPRLDCVPVEVSLTVTVDFSLQP